MMRFSGWRTLEGRYPDRDDRESRRFGWQTASLGYSFWRSSVYRNAMTITVCATGLRLRPNRALLPLARSVFIPWTALSPKISILLVMREWDLHIAETAGLRLSLRAALATRLDDASGGKLGLKTVTQPPN
ncbi:hypothetical protein [Aurantiacibacter gangjinensis]|uniref:Uncharacterized protein n=1 Tax=Aurantiacibacter gangjinensis TaxID=502682 RepID=A0A0G9MPR0_9SPHN|nr:hypothetical protein [Aurantiacibacter gangjinensis]KLE32707.1 hypothetical protein AAW01_01235 [Aurantiacibacter gangjinensis]